MLLTEADNVRHVARLSYVALFSFACGLAVLFASLAAREGSAPQPPSEPFNLIRPEVTVTPASSPSVVVPGIARPTPFDGNVGRIVATDIGVDHAIEAIGVTNGQLDVPEDGNDKVGWYAPYAKPGHGGNSVFAAHLNFNKRPGPFANLQNIHALDRISIIMEGGPTYVYEVVAYLRYDVVAMPTGELIDAPTRPNGEEWITLITCGGDFVPDPGSEFGHYEQRDVVIARRIE